MLLEAAVMSLALMGEPSKKQNENRTNAAQIIFVGLKDTKDGCPIGQVVRVRTVSDNAGPPGSRNDGARPKPTSARPQSGDGSNKPTMKVRTCVVTANPKF